MRGLLPSHLVLGVPAVSDSLWCSHAILGERGQRGSSFAAAVLWPDLAGQGQTLFAPQELSALFLNALPSHNRQGALNCCRVYQVDSAVQQYSGAKSIPFGQTKLIQTVGNVPALAPCCLFRFNQLIVPCRLNAVPLIGSSQAERRRATKNKGIVVAGGLAVHISIQSSPTSVQPPAPTGMCSACLPMPTRWKAAAINGLIQVIIIT